MAVDSMRDLIAGPEVGRMTPAEVIANVLHHIEDEGMNDEETLSFAGDILHALRVAGLVVVSTEDRRDNTMKEMGFAIDHGSPATLMVMRRESQGAWICYRLADCSPDSVGLWTYRHLPARTRR